ncbi:MAG: 2-amino-4-hydroxy-6-hydroxymethyldihydropteridine diphosphokinase [Chloroflexota bacterium]
MEDSRKIYLSLGTNLGDKVDNIQRAIDGLRLFMTFDAISSVYETAPWGPIQDQPSFYNLCASGRTELDPISFLDCIKALEAEIGRLDTERWGARLIDVDLLFYEDVQMVTDRLIIPHKEIAGRAFVLVPLAEIAPDLIHPKLKTDILGLQYQLPKSDLQSVVKLITPNFNDHDSITSGA